jgi:ACS family hexuronate transporter-like MFS transporter
VLVLGLLGLFGTWRPVFIVTGSLGLLWLLAFRRLYRRPEEHPRLGAAEREYILADRAHAATADAPRTPYGRLLRLKQTWGIILGKTLTDPVWFFITDWFAVYLVARGFPLEQSLLAFWVPFLAADAGNFLGGGVSSFLIRRGIGVGTARKAVIAVGGVGMGFLAPTIYMDSLVPLTVCFAIATCCYAAVSTMVLNLPADLYHTASVASVSGMSGTGAGLGTIVATFLTGWVADRYSFEPILLVASVVPLLAVAAVLTLVRNDAATQAGLVRPI